MRNFIKAGIFILLLIAMQACYYDNEEELYPQQAACDTTNVGYAATISIIMENNCNTCHGSDFPQANVITDNYTDLKVIADNGRLWGAVNHENGYSPMPNNLPKLSDCNLSKIRIWLDNGALND